MTAIPHNPGVSIWIITININITHVFQNIFKIDNQPVFSCNQSPTDSAEMRQTSRMGTRVHKYVTSIKFYQKLLVHMYADVNHKYFIDEMNRLN